MNIPHLTRCRVCRCTEVEPCNPPCAWEPGEPDLCTTCAEVIRIVRQWREEEAVQPSFAALQREVLKPRAAVLKRKAATR
jgi:hypothetical protein